MGLCPCRDKLLVGQHDGLMEVGVTDEAVIHEEVLLSTTPQSCRRGTYEAPDTTEGTLVAYGEQSLGELRPTDPEDALLLCATWEHLVILPRPFEREGYLRVS